MASIWFIDTNVIASWVIVKSNLLRLLSERYSLPSEYHRLYEERFKENVEFIDRILNSDREKFQKKYEIYFSFLASNELFSAIKDEVLSLKLFHKGEPVSRWPGAKNFIKLSKDEAKFIYDTTVGVWDTLFDERIVILDDDPDIDSTPAETNSIDSDYWDVYAPLLFTMDNTKTQDIMLITTAIMNGADVFVTRDERLINSVKKVLKEEYELEIIKPNTANLRMKKELQSID